MDLTNLISVFVPTHIVRADYDPFIKNEMIVETIKQTHEKLNLGDVEFFIYPDARFKKSHPHLMEQYCEYLDSIENMPGFENININVVRDSRETMRNNWLKFIEDCKTPYMLFLEHDWKFNKNINLKQVIDVFKDNPKVGYVKFNRLPSNAADNLASSICWDWIHEVDNTLKTDLTLHKVSFFSGNPHVASVKRCREFYIPEMFKHCPPEMSKGSSHLEKDIKKAALSCIDSYRACGYKKERGHMWPLSAGASVGKGCSECETAIRKQQEIWGLYSYVEPFKIVQHLGDHCRKE